MATIHYLVWDSGDEAAQDLFRNLHFARQNSDSGVRKPIALPKTKYREIREIPDLRHPEDAFITWNRGSGEESPLFEEFTVCEGCDSQFTTISDGETHVESVHNSEDYDRYLRGIRSMSVGDVVETEDGLQMVASLGFIDAVWMDDAEDDDVIYPNEVSP